MNLLLLGVYIFPGLRNYFVARCKRRESMGQKISFCNDIRTQLDLLDNGTLPAPEGKCLFCSDRI